MYDQSSRYDNFHRIIQLILLLSLSLWALITHATPSQVAAETLKTIHVQFNWHHQFQYGGFYAALQQGYYRQAGLDVQLHSLKGDKQVLTEVLEGRADFGIGYSTVIADYINGAPIQVLSTSFQHSPMVLLTHEPIGDLSELAGKVGMYNDSLQVLSLINKASKEKRQPVVKRQATTQLKEFIDKKVDFYAAFVTNEPFQLQEMGVPFYIVDPKLYGVNSADDFLFTTQAFANAHPAVVAAFREATIKGWEYALANPDRVIDFMLANYSVPKSKRALAYEAKALVPYVSVGSRPIGVIEPTRLKDTALELKEIGLISQTDFDAFEPKTLLGLHKHSIQLTQQEWEYLRQHPVIQLGNDIDWAPFEFIDQQGMYKGLAAEYFQIFEKQLGVKFEPQSKLRWSEVLQAASEGKIKVFSGATRTPERQAYMHFTDPYLSFPMVLVAQNNTDYVAHFAELSGKRVAVIRGYWAHEYFRNNYPNVSLLVVDSVNEGLMAVVGNQVDFYAENLASVNYAIRQYGLSNIAIVGESPQKFELAIGVHHSEPMLFSIMQKALASVSEEDKRAIHDHWIKIEMVKRLDRQQLVELAGVIFVIFIGLILVLLVYRYQRNRFQRYIDEIHELHLASKIDLVIEKVVWSSQSYARLRKCELEQMMDDTFSCFSAKKLSAEQVASIKSQLFSGNPWEGEVEGIGCDGTTYWVILRLTPIKNWLGKITHAWATRVDISDKKRIEQLSNTDELTQLYNRHYFNQTLPELIASHQSSGKHLCLASIDIDFFKLVNDHYGHVTGDKVLKQVAHLLKECCHEHQALTFRMGGEEFLVVAFFEQEARFYQQLELLRQTILNAKIENIESPLKVVSISIGACCWSDADSIENWELLYRQVDDLLYQAKQSGRNKLVNREAG